MIKIMFLALLAAALGYGLYRAIAVYRMSDGSPWDKLLATAKNSATVLWQYIVAGGGIAMLYLGQAAELLNMPEMRTFIQEKLQPEYVGSALLAIAVITIVARLRTLRSEG
jgi:hypothetical protein